MKHIILIILLCLFKLPAWAQQTISAHVVDSETGEALPYVTVYVSQENYTITNAEGNFTLRIAPQDTVRISFIGYQTLRIKAQDVPATLALVSLTNTMREVTVRPLNAKSILSKVVRKLDNEYSTNKDSTSQYFCRIVTDMPTSDELCEAFLQAHSAVNLRDISFQSGRYGTKATNGVEKSIFQHLNFQHVMELSPMMFDNTFWNKLYNPLGHDKRSFKYQSSYYDSRVTELYSEDERRVCCISIKRNERPMPVVVWRPNSEHPQLFPRNSVMTGDLYVDMDTYELMSFNGEIEGCMMLVTREAIQSMDSLEMKIRINFRHDRGYTEIADLSASLRQKEIECQASLLNITNMNIPVESKGLHSENMLQSIDSVGFDSVMWAQSGLIKRTSKEEYLATRLTGKSLLPMTVPQSNKLSDFVDRMEAFGRAIPQEKVYVHMNNTSYFLGDTIWFAAYTRQTTDDRPSKVSGLLYVELLNQDGYLVERKLIEMTEGRGNGFFALNRENLYSGFYELRAYTRWQLNWGIQEHPHSHMASQWFASKELEHNYYRDYDKLYSRVFPVYDAPLEEGGYERSMTPRPLQRKEAEKEGNRRLILLFYPEGGNLVADVPCRVAFEVAWDDGEWVEGWLHIGADSVPVLNRGRGMFTITPHQGEEKELRFVTHDGESATAKLPQPEQIGVTLRTDIVDEGVMIGLHVTGDLNPDSLGMTVMHEGVVERFLQPSQKESAFLIKDSELGTGVNQLTVFDSQGRVWADRLFFITKMDMMQPTLSVSGAKESYTPYEPINLTISSTRETEEGKVSLSVCDARNSDKSFDNGTILTEMLLGSEIRGFVPNPKWFFEKDDEEHRQALDLLMMTQGWRRFNWREMAVRGAWDLTQPKETTQILPGRVCRPGNADPRCQEIETERRILHPEYYSGESPEQRRDFREGVNEEVVVRATAVSTDDKLPLADRQTQQGGRFTLVMPHFYGDCILYLGALPADKYDSSVPYQWEEMYDPEYLSMKELRKEQITPSELQVLVDFPYPRFVKPYTFYQVNLMPDPMAAKSPQVSEDGTKTLKEISVRSRLRGLRQFSDTHPAFILDGIEAHNAIMDAGMYYADDLLARTYLGDMGLASVSVLSETDMEERDNKVQQYSRIRHRYGATSHLRTVLGDNIAPEDSAFWGKFLKSYPQSYSLSLGERRKYLGLGVIEKQVVYTDYCPRREGDIHYQGSNLPEIHIADYPYEDEGQHAVYRDRCIPIPGFAYPADFYSPDYSRQRLPEGQKDYRRTLYWNPNLQLDENGQARITFYNNSRTTQISVEAEGQASDGTLLWSK